MTINDDLFSCFYEESVRTRPNVGATGHAQFTRGAEWGAGWMAAIIGMAEAIRQNYGPSPFSAYLKERVAAEGRSRGGWETHPISNIRSEEP